MDCSGWAWRSHLYMTYTPRPFIRSICNVSFVIKHFICEFGNGMLRGAAPVNLRERESVSCPNATGSQFCERQMTITWVAVISREKSSGQHLLCLNPLAIGWFSCQMHQQEELKIIHTSKLRVIVTGFSWEKIVRIIFDNIVFASKNFGRTKTN
jgi:hypothetical protein